MLDIHDGHGKQASSSNISLESLSSQMIIDARLHGLGHILRDRLLGVPPYQRSYSWTKEQVREYWDDLHAAFLAGQRDYFLGTIVLVGEKKTKSRDRYMVVDGQQRLATTVILFSAIRDAFAKNGSRSEASTIQQTYLVGPIVGAPRPVERFKLNTADHNYFLKTVLTYPSGFDKAVYSSHRRLADATQIIGDAIKDLVVNRKGKWKKTLQDFVEFIDKAVQVIAVEVPRDTDAFLIFETLNDRGLALTIADLLKNFLLATAKTRSDEVLSAWHATLGLLEQSAERDEIRQFIRHYWVSRYGVTRERDLYKEVKKTLTTEQQVVDFAFALQNAARFYAALLNRDAQLWVDMGSSTKAAVESLLRLNLKQIRPLLLSVTEEFSKTELKRALRAIVCWSVRGLVVGNIGGGETEARYAQAARQIREKKITNSQELFVELQSVIPLDSVFESAFSNLALEGTRRKLNRYFLVALERTKSGEAQPEVVPNSDEEEVNLEHVLPQKAVSADWPKFEKDELETWAARLGNLVLLQEKTNNKLANSTFAKKQSKLVKSRLKLTAMVGKRKDWSPEEIGSRQVALAELAVTTWPREPK